MYRLNSKVLKGLLCVALVSFPLMLSAQSRGVKNPLYGSKHSAVPVTSSTLKGAVFYLVSGHGGPDPGAIGKVGKISLHEDEYAYDITLRLARTLESKGAKVYMIIQDKRDGIRSDKYLKNSKTETCMGQAIPLNQVRRLQQRCAKVNELYRRDKSRYKRAICIHVDSRSVKQQLDVFFYYAPGSTSGKRSAENMRNTFRAEYQSHQPSRGFSGTVSSRGLYMLTQTTPITTYVELANLRNTSDQRRLLIEDNRQALANWMCQAYEKEYKSLR